MPRDLTALAADVQDEAVSNLHQLTKSPESVSSDVLADASDPSMNSITSSAPLSKRDHLHPYTQTLTVTDVDSCVRLEDATFPPQERCTREKFEYRFSKCGELSLGIFTSHEGNDIPTAETSAPVYSGTPQRKAVLLGHLVATRTTNETVSDDDMAMPASSPDANPKLGHKEHGRTVCIHSLAVLPAYQRRGLGQTLLKSYIDRLETQDVADRLALISHQPLIPFYERLGFQSLGPSKATFGGGGWFDMVRPLKGNHPGGF